MSSESPNKVSCYGPSSVVARVRWAPSSAAVQTLTDACGVLSVTRSGAGAYVVNLAPHNVKALLALPSYVDDDITNFHFVEATASSASARTVNVRHRTCAFADIASGPTASDTVDEIEVLILERTST